MNRTEILVEITKSLIQAGAQDNDVVARAIVLTDKILADEERVIAEEENETIEEQMRANEQRRQEQREQPRQDANTRINRSTRRNPGHSPFIEEDDI